MGRKIKSKDEVRQLLADEGPPSRANGNEELDEDLDEALRETFPASDPPAMTSRLKPGRRGRRKKAEE
jgi:hypothetical protein